MASPLTSPGAATAARAAFELELAGVMLSSLGGFTRAVKASAMAAGAPAAFTLGETLGAWLLVVDDVVALLSVHGLDADYTRAARSRLAAADLPAQVYESARVVLTQAATHGWSRQHLSRELGHAVDPETPFVQLTLTAALVPEEKLGPSAATLARMIARTEATAGYGHAALKVMAAFGRPEKRWVAHHDSRTRPTHAKASGQTAALGKSFIVGGYALLYPGDPSAPWQETANCRCTLVAVGKATMQPTDLLETLGPKPSSLLRGLIGNSR